MVILTALKQPAEKSVFASTSWSGMIDALTPLSSKAWVTLKFAGSKAVWKKFSVGTKPSEAMDDVRMFLMLEVLRKQ